MQRIDWLWNFWERSERNGGAENAALGFSQRRGDVEVEAGSRMSDDG